MTMFQLWQKGRASPCPATKVSLGLDSFAAFSILGSQGKRRGKGCSGWDSRSAGGHAARSEHCSGCFQVPVRGRNPRPSRPRRSSGGGKTVWYRRCVCFFSRFSIFWNWSCYVWLALVPASIKITLDLTLQKGKVSFSNKPKVICYLNLAQTCSSYGFWPHFMV